MITKKLQQLAAITLLVSSCGDSLTDQSVGTGKDGPSEQITVQFFETSGQLDSKSSFNGIGNSLDNVGLWVFDEDGVMLKHSYLNGQNSETLTLVSGHRYSFYALANLYSDLGGAIVRESEIQQLSLSLGQMSQGVNGRNLPMAGSVLNFLLMTTGTVEIPLERLFSKVVFRFDPDETLSRQNVTLTSIRLKNSASTIRPFMTDSWSSSCEDGDYASVTDLNVANSSGRVEFYALENCCGSINNTDSRNKLPESAPRGNPTYLEVACSLDGPKMSGDVTYRFCIGSNNSSDYNLRRNRTYTVRLCSLSSSVEANEDYWKLDAADVVTGSNVIVLTIGRNSLGLVNNPSTTVTAKVERRDNQGAKIADIPIGDCSDWQFSSSNAALIQFINNPTAAYRKAIQSVNAGTTVISATCKYNGETLCSVSNPQLEVVDDIELAWSDNNNLKFLCNNNTTKTVSLTDFITTNLSASKLSSCSLELVSLTQGANSWTSSESASVSGMNLTVSFGSRTTTGTNAVLKLKLKYKGKEYGTKDVELVSAKPKLSFQISNTSLVLSGGLSGFINNPGLQVSATVRYGGNSVSGTANIPYGMGTILSFSSLNLDNLTYAQAKTITASATIRSSDGIVYQAEFYPRMNVMLPNVAISSLSTDAPKITVNGLSGNGTGVSAYVPLTIPSN